MQHLESLTVVERDGVQTVEQLPLVLMDPLYLDIKDGLWVHLHLTVLLQECSKLQLVFLWRQTGSCEWTDRQLNR